MSKFDQPRVTAEEIAAQIVSNLEAAEGPDFEAIEMLFNTPGAIDLLAEAELPPEVTNALSDGMETVVDCGDWAQLVYAYRAIISLNDPDVLVMAQAIITQYIVQTLTSNQWYQLAAVFDWLSSFEEDGVPAPEELLSLFKGAVVVTTESMLIAGRWDQLRNAYDAIQSLGIAEDFTLAREEVEKLHNYYVDLFYDGVQTYFTALLQYADKEALRQTPPEVIKHYEPDQLDQIFELRYFLNMLHKFIITDFKDIPFNADILLHFLREIADEKVTSEEND